MFMYTYLFESLILILSGIYLRVDILGHMVILHLSFGQIKNSFLSSFSPSEYEFLLPSGDKGTRETWSLTIVAKNLKGPMIF